MNRGAWQAIVHGIVRVRCDLVTKPLPYSNKSEKKKKVCEKLEAVLNFWMPSVEQPLSPNHNEDVL